MVALFWMLSGGAAASFAAQTFTLAFSSGTASGVFGGGLSSVSGSVTVGPYGAGTFAYSPGSSSAFIFNVAGGYIAASVSVTPSGTHLAAVAGSIVAGTGVFAGASGSVNFTLDCTSDCVGKKGTAFQSSLTGSGSMTLIGAQPASAIPPNLTAVHGVACSDPVTVNNGNLTQQQMDLATSSRGPAIWLQRTYNSLLASTDGPFGYGWTHNYAMSLLDHQSSVTFVSPNGAAFQFAAGGGGYASPPGINLTLTKPAQGYKLQSLHGTVWAFNGQGILQSITDRNGNAVQLTYDSNGNMVRVTDALNRAVTFTYDSNYHITLVQDFAGRQISYTYDDNGNLTSVVDLGGNRTQYVYYTSQALAHALQTVTKPKGNSTSFQYDSNARVSLVSDTAGRSMAFAYSPSQSQTTFTDPRGFKGTYSYDALGNVTRIVNAAGAQATTTYAANGQIASQTDENGNTTSYTYDVRGNLTSSTDANGAVTTLTYEPVFNQVASLTDPLGNVTNLQYDAHGNLTQVTRPLGVTLAFTYDNYGELLTATDGQGNRSAFTYDSSGNRVKAVDPVGNATQYSFDNLRRLTAVVDAMNGKRTFQWDALSRLVQAVDPLGNKVARSFDANGNLSQFTDPNGAVTAYAYDALDNLTTVNDAKSGVTRYGYAVPNCGCSSGSDLVAYQDAAGVSRTQTYDFAERVNGAADATQDLTAFTYNPRGDLVTRTDANGAATQFQYDANRRLLQKTYPDGSTASFTYDANGNMTSATNANSSLTFSYDALNRVSSVTDSRFSQTIQYSYDHNGRRVVMADPEGGMTGYTYDANGRLTSVTNPLGATFQFSFDALNRLAARADSNGLAGAYQYDASGRLTSVSYAGANSAAQSSSRRRRAAQAMQQSLATQALAQFNYAYDSNGNPTAITDVTGTNSYQFDTLNRLTAAAHPSLPVESYSYDGAGNRLASATSSSYAYDTDGRLTQAEGESYAYDNNGNQITRTDANGVTTYTYDFENRLTSITLPDGTSAAYQYDALGRRTQKSVNGVVTNYLYDGSDILLEMDVNGVMLARYTHGAGVDQMLTMERGGQTYFYYADRMGSIAALADSNGNPVCSYTYDSFGRTQPCTALVNPFAFAGREYDSESGLYAMRARYYDPSTGRFLSADPLDLTGRLLLAQSGTARPAILRTPQQLNRYGYAAANPLVFRDPSGLSCSKPGGTTVLGSFWLWLNRPITTPPPTTPSVAPVGGGGGASGGGNNPQYPGGGNQQYPGGQGGGATAGEVTAGQGAAGEASTTEGVVQTTIEEGEDNPGATQQIIQTLQQWVQEYPPLIP